VAMVCSTIVENVLALPQVQKGLFFAKQSQFKKSQMNITLNISRDYEKKSSWTFSENKPKQSQSFDFTQDKFFESEDREQKTEDRGLPASGGTDDRRRCGDG